MMAIFDNVNQGSNDQLTMSQFIRGCLSDPFMAQLLAPTQNTDYNIINSTDQSATATKS